MLVKLVSMEARCRFLSMVSHDACYEIIYPLVEDGGEGVHDAYHLILNDGSELKDAFGGFPPLPNREVPYVSNCTFRASRCWEYLPSRS